MKHRRVQVGRLPKMESEIHRPNVSVVITCHNYGHYLRQSVRSALDQESVSVDVVVVDDASTDDSLQVARGLAAEDSRIRVVELEKNKGPAGAFNSGLELCAGEYVVRLDADDLLTPGSLARSTNLLMSMPSVGLVYGHPIHFSSSQPPARFRNQVRSWTIWSGDVWLQMRCRRAVNCITSPEAVIRRTVIEQVGGMRNLAHTHDFEWWMRLSAVSDVGHINGVDQAYHRVHSGSFSRAFDVRKDLTERKGAFDALFAGLPDTPRSALERQWYFLALRRLSMEALSEAVRMHDHGSGGSQLESDLVDFAVATSTDAKRSSLWRALNRRRRFGSRLVRRSGLGLTSRVHRWLISKAIGVRWGRTGV